jgi:general nucleoside transport system permease protein
MSASDATTIVSGTVALSCPLLFAGCGEYVAERAGTLNISVEGMMLAGAYGGAAGSSLGGAVAGLVLGIACGLSVAVVQANFSHRLAANTFVVGLVLNALALGTTDYLSNSFQISPERIGDTAVPLLRDIPVIGKPVFDAPWPTYLLFGLIPLTWYLVERRRWGLEVRAVGENPGAADATGIDVNRRRRQAVYWCGCLSGLGGAYLALAVVGTFNQDMTDGIGYVVIAAVIFGGWRLGLTMFGCLLFGGARAMSLVLPVIGVQANPQLLIASPYLIALVALSFLSARHRAPAALAVPFERGVV